MKKLLSLSIILALVTTFYACKDDENTDLAAPVVTAPAATNVQISTPVDLSFTYTAAAGFKSSSASATGGTATVKTDGTADQTSGTIVVTFTADANAGAGSVTLTVTDKEDDSDDATVVITKTTTPTPPANEVLSGVLDGSEDGSAADDLVELTNDRIWELAGRVIVPDGVTIDIQEGTIIKGREGSGSLASALIIARGGKIMAEGTATQPIIFTSILDDIEVGDKVGPNLDAEDDTGLWGGVIILGKATVGVATGEAQIEGVPADIEDAKYGGGATPNDADNSGVFKYVSIRHGGALLGANNEINGLTLGGVGSGTVIEYVEVVGNEDDGIEFFGGTVNVTNALVWAQKDDGYDVDQAYAGTINNVIYIAGPEGDHGMEIDGTEGGGVSRGFTLQNGSFKGKVGEYGDFRDKARGTVKDCYFFNYKKGDDFELDADGSDNGSAKFSDNPGVSDNFKGSGHAFTGSLILTGLEFNSTVTDDAALKTIDQVFFDKWNKAPVLFDATDTRTDGDATTQAAANKATFNGANTMVTTATKTKGADKTKFTGWTMADAKGQLADF